MNPFGPVKPIWHIYEQAWNLIWVLHRILWDTRILGFKKVIGRGILYQKNYYPGYLAIDSLMWKKDERPFWVGFEPTTTEFRSEALTDSGHEFNSHSEPTLYSFIVKFHFAITSISCHVCFNWNFLEVITRV